MKAVEISGRKIGSGFPCFVIAEAGVNHNGNLDTARKLIDAAVSSGADAVKFQTFKADRLATESAPKADYQNKTTDKTESQLQMLRRLELSDEAHCVLKDYCQARDILFMSTPFDELSADFLDALGVKVFKIGSGELTNLPFLAHVASKSKPMIVSTGMATLGEVEAAVRTVNEAGNHHLVLLQCVSNYPAAPSDANLRAMNTMQTAFGVPVGYSDHTMGIEVSLAAVALGACVIEKHFTLDRTLPGPDQEVSLEPGELAALVKGVRMVEAALGDGYKRPSASEANTALVARKSLAAAQDIPVGTVLTEKMITIKRPGNGLPPMMKEYLIGRTTRIAIRRDMLLTLEMLS